jgi:hypothetical protein
MNYTYGIDFYFPNFKMYYFLFPKKDVTDLSKFEYI